MPGTKDKREKPEIITRPKDSEIYHHDPNLWFGTSNKQDYVQHTPHAATMAVSYNGLHNANSKC